MRLRPTPFTLANFRAARQMYQDGLSLGSILAWPVRSRLLKGPYSFRLRNGVSFLTPRDLNFQLLLREIWAEEHYGGAGIRIRPQATVIDIGANIGLFALWVATRATGVNLFAVEPSPRMCGFLRTNITRNGINATVVQAACGGSNGRATLYSRGTETKNTVYPRDAFHAELQPVGDVEMISLAELFRRFSIGFCDLLKLDCEGAEYDILLNAPEELLQSVRQVALEYHVGFEPGRSPGQIEDRLASCGFKVFRRPMDDQTGYLYATRELS